MRLIEYSAESIFGHVNISPATLFSALAHDTRLRCLLLLLEHEELCVCELTNAIDAAQPHMSRHLGQLREASLVTDRREGLWIHYRINPELPTWVTNLLWETATGVRNVEPFVNDLAALAAMPNRPVALHCA
jgi:ArsR family transcriptional regulator